MVNRWIGAAPCTCDICKAELVGMFVDGKTQMGPWACMCAECHARVGVGLGTGGGQRYERQADGSWLCTKGGRVAKGSLKELKDILGDNIDVYVGQDDGTWKEVKGDE